MKGSEITDLITQVLSDELININLGHSTLIYLPLIYVPYQFSYR